MNGYFSLSTIYFCLSRFLPIIIYSYNYFYQSDALATRKSDFQFAFYFWADFWQFPIKVFSKIPVGKNKNRTPKVCRKLKTKQKAVKPFYISLPKANNETERNYIISAMSSSVFQFKCFQDFISGFFSGFQGQNTKQKCAEILSKIIIVGAILAFPCFWQTF